jgi:Transposase DDE domain group 1
VRCYNPDEITVAFDDEQSVADAGLLLPATLAVGLGLRELLDTYIDLGEAPGRANAADKAMTLLHSALAGGSWIDDCDRLRGGSTGQVLGHRVLAPSTIGTFLRSFTFGHARQLDAVSGQALQRAWQAGAGPDAAPLTIDVDSTICEVYGTHKQGAEFGHTKVRGYIRCWRSPPAPGTCCMPGCAAAAPTPPAARPALSPRRSVGSGRRAPAGR